MSAPANGNGISAFVFDGGRAGPVERDVEEWPDEDAFGNTGSTIVEQRRTVALCEESAEAIATWYQGEGFTELPADANLEDERLRMQRILTDASNPFLQEHVVQVGVAWRELLGAQRSVLQNKLTALRAEVGGRKTSKRRRAKVGEMLAELEAGLLTTVRVESTRRLFKIDPVLDAEGSIGSVLPLTRLDQLLYTVTSQAADGVEEEEPEPMFLTILGTDGYSVAFLYSGGILGQRIINDLDVGFTHHAWFRNRQCDRTDDTAPWISRKVYLDLASSGESELIVRRERDASPVKLSKVGEDSLRVRTADGPRDVPVVVAETSKEDRLWIVRDEASPLVLKMEEAGADLLRTIDEIRRLEL